MSVLCLGDLSPLCTATSVVCDGLLWHNQDMRSTCSIRPIGIGDVAELYDLHNLSGVCAFLLQRPRLQPLLVDVAKNVRCYFPDARLALDVYPDPDLPSWVTLAIKILTHERYPRTRDRLNAFRREWWNSTDEELTRDVIVGVDPI